MKLTKPTMKVAYSAPVEVTVNTETGEVEKVVLHSSDMEVKDVTPEGRQVKCLHSWEDWMAAKESALHMAEVGEWPAWDYN